MSGFYLTCIKVSSGIMKQQLVLGLDACKTVHAHI